MKHFRAAEFMKIQRAPHAWSLTPRKAIAVQRQLARRVSIIKSRQIIRWVAGLDAAFSRDQQFCIAGVVLWDLRETRIVEQCTADRRLTFPYIPGLLSFRELPACLAALRKLRHEPDLLMCDGQGLAHPRRFGIACHLGVIVDLPALGCAKSRLVGAHVEPAQSRGSRVPLLEGGEILGTVLRTQSGIKPVYVSIGHKIDLPTAERIVLDCALKYRLPEPTRQADRLVAMARQNQGR